MVATAIANKPPVGWNAKDSNYRGHQTRNAIKACGQWLAAWDRGHDVPSIRLTAGGPNYEIAAQMLVVAMVRELNGKLPSIPIAFIKHAEFFAVLLQDQGFELSQSALGGCINWAYWLLRDGPELALPLYPAISWQKVNGRWPLEPRRE